MLRTILAALVLSVACVCSAAAAAPLEAFGALPNVDDVQVSPDGQYFAVVAGLGSNRQVQIRRMSDKHPITYASAAGMKIRGLMWAGSGHLLVLSTQTLELGLFQTVKVEVLQALDYDLSKKKWWTLLSRPHATGVSVILGVPTLRKIDGHEIAFVTGVLDRERTFMRVDLDTEKATPVASGGTKTYAWLVDHDGRPVARAEYDQSSGRWAAMIQRDGRWVLAHEEIAPLDIPSLATVGVDGRSVLVREGGKEEGGWHRIGLSDAAWSPEVTEYKDDARLIADHDGAPIGAVRLTPEKPVYQFFSPNDQRIWDMIVAAFPGEQVGLASWSDDRSKIIVKVEGPKDGDAYYAVDMTTGHAEWIADQFKGVGPEDVSPVKFITYKAQDGLEIPAYLTLPKDRPAKALPLIVLVHGGPAARDVPGFDWWSQALASRGYAVLQPEFRGSYGFGDAFLQAGYGQWGRKMQTDVSDGVSYLAAEGVIDPKRVCIVGASYGGYAALAGATLQAGFYRCAVSVAGISDPKRMLQAAGDHWGDPKNFVLRYWDRYMGVKGAGDPKLREISPVAYVALVKSPVLLIHGQDDTVVPYEQSQVMADALKRAGKPVEFVTLKGEDHWLSRGETRLQMLEATVNFLQANNPPDPPPRSKMAAASSLH